VRCPKEIEDQEHEQVLTSERPAIVCERDRREHLRMDLAADPHSGQPPARRHVHRPGQAHSARPQN
jgi:hypothetical protein